MTAFFVLCSIWIILSPVSAFSMYFFGQIIKNDHQDKKMNYSDQDHGWKLCVVSTETSGTVQYVCYINERCCEQGCCSIYNYRHMQSWYFWILLFLLCSIFYSCSWYCKRLEDSRRKRLRQLANRRPPSEQSSPRVDIDFKEQSLSNKEELEPPPQYLEALKMPTVPIVQIHYNKNMDKNDDDLIVASTSTVPPSYDDVIENKQEKNDRQA